MRQGVYGDGVKQAGVIVRLPMSARAIMIAAIIIMPILQGAGAIGAA